MNVAVNSFAATESAQGVRQVCPVDVLTSAPGGSDSNSTVLAAGAAWKLGQSKLGKEPPEQAASAMLDAVIMKTLRIVISVNSRGLRPHPQVTLSATRKGLAVPDLLRYQRRSRSPAEVFGGRHARQAYTLLTLCS